MYGSSRSIATNIALCILLLPVAQSNCCFENYIVTIALMGS